MVHSCLCQRETIVDNKYQNIDITQVRTVFLVQTKVQLSTNPTQSSSKNNQNGEAYSEANFNNNSQSLMRNQDSLSNVSASRSDPYGLKLNGSSKSSTPENETDPKHRRFLEFEEYRNARPSLKIRIDNNQEEEYDQYRKERWADLPRKISEEQDGYGSQSLHSPIERDFEEDKPIKLIIEYREKIDQLSEKVRKLEEKVFYYEDYNRRLLSDYQEIKSNEQEHFRVIRELDIAIKNKQQNCFLHRELIENLNKKIQFLQSQQEFMKEMQQIMLKKDSKIRELSKTIEKIYTIKRDLETDLHQSSKKIVQLEKQIQKLSYSELKQNIIKLKENMPINKNSEIQSSKQRRSLKKSDKPITFKTQPNEKIIESIDRYHFSRKY